MGDIKIIGAAVPNMPWQERQADGKAWMPYGGIQKIRLSGAIR